MKPRPHTDSAVRLPAAVLTRAMLAAVIVLGSVLVFLGCRAERPIWVAAGGVALAIGGAMYTRPQWRNCFWPNEPDLAAFTPEGLEEKQAAELLSLLNQWEEIEAKRGSADFDPWALQSLRNDIRRKVESDPVLEQLFSDLRRAA